MEMIQNPERIDSWRFTNLTLLPIHPPEINPFVFKWMMNCFEICVQEFPISRVKDNRLFY
jgi:hypothetical protein